MGKHSESDDSDYSRERRKSSRSKKSDSHHRNRSSSHSRKHRRRRDNNVVDDTDSSSKTESSDDNHERRKKDRHSKRQKKVSKKSESRRERRKKDKKRYRDEDDDDKHHHRHHRKRERNNSDFESISLQRSYALADSLCHLFQNHPALVDDLPIMLIQLARGTSFNLNQMTDIAASRSLQDVFQCLNPFGLDRDETGCWVWKSPGGGASGGAKAELILLQVVRGLLDQIGITMEAVEGYGIATQHATSRLGETTGVVKDVNGFNQENASKETTMNTTYEAPSSDDEDGEIGPSPTVRVVGPVLPPEVIKAQANRRAKELAMATTGVEVEMTKEDDTSGREEWMLTPGKVDFLQVLKPGQSTTSRKFENKKQSDSSQTHSVVDPKVQAELDAIMKAHAEARGPTLMEQHRLAQAAKKEAGEHKEWKWSRDKDLDSDRRVDKSALQQVFGGASEGLHKKFQGGFR